MVLYAPDVLSSKLVLKFLNDSKVSPELKEICYKFMENQFVEKLFRRTPVSLLFDVIEEYRKFPSLYDEALSGRIKFCLKGSIKESFPVFNRNSISEYLNLKSLFLPDAFVRQVVELFAKCEESGFYVKKISIKICDYKMIYIGLNSRNERLTTHVDFLHIDDFDGYFIDFINSAPSKRIDLIRI